MINKEIDTEQIVIEAAEAEFLEKGFGNTKMAAIAKRAGLNHAMPYYYFRTKENLFQMIFQQKILIISQMFEGVNVKNLSFNDTIRLLIELQFSFIAKNPRLPFFVINEVISKKENRNLFMDVVSPKISDFFGFIENKMNEEIKKGYIRPANFHQLIIDIFSVNMFTFIALPLLKEFNPDFKNVTDEFLLNERCESNVQFILNSLKINQ